MVSKRQAAEQGDFISDGYPARRATYGTCQAMADQKTKEKKCPMDIR